MHCPRVLLTRAAAAPPPPQQQQRAQGAPILCSVHRSANMHAYVRDRMRETEKARVDICWQEQRGILKGRLRCWAAANSTVDPAWLTFWRGDPEHCQQVALQCLHDLAEPGDARGQGRHFCHPSQVGPSQHCLLLPAPSLCAPAAVSCRVIASLNGMLGSERVTQRTVRPLESHARAKLNDNSMR